MLGVRPGNCADSGVLIHWKGMLEFDATWERFSKIQNQFPEFHLEDNVLSWAAGIDKPPICFTYERRKGKSKDS